MPHTTTYNNKNTQERKDRDRKTNRENEADEFCVLFGVDCAELKEQLPTFSVSLRLPGLRIIAEAVDAGVKRLNADRAHCGKGVGKTRLQQPKSESTNRVIEE